MVAIRALGRTEYEPTWRAMQAFTAARAGDTPDEIWLTEHPPVYTLGLAGRREHLLRDNGIPTIKVDRGGQITYHGPGQLSSICSATCGDRISASVRWSGRSRPRW